MKRPKNGSTMKQRAYAMRTFGGQGESRRQAALSVGYAQSVADKPYQKIESTEGYANAMMEMASQCGNAALRVFFSLQTRDFDKAPLPEVLEAVRTLADAFNKYTPASVKNPDKATPKLRNVLLQHVENQTITTKQN